MLDALTHDQLRVFVAVAEAGSFRAAAGRLQRVQSAVSHAIANLEAELGVALFDRGSHRPVLTPQGRALLEDARAILLKVDLMRARARGLGEGVELGLSLVVDTLFSTDIVGAALQDLRLQYPTLGMRLLVLPMGALFDELREGRCNIGIAAGESFRDPLVELEILSRLQFIAVCAGTHPLAAIAAQRRLLGVDDLADHLQIVQEDPSSQPNPRDLGVLSPQTWRVGTQDAKYALIRSGLGWGRLPDWQVARDLAEGRLVRLAVAGLPGNGDAAVDVFLAWRRDLPFGPAARAFRAALRRHAGVA